ncbi:hypothetical protein ACWC1D_12380 [Streptomyces sp. NPDC001478]
MRDTDGLPSPTPGDTARLDQLAARWRDTEPEVRQEVADAADAVRASPSEDAVAALLDALGRAGRNLCDGQ